MKKSINIKGISTTSAYEDGDCMTLVNLRKKNGVMKPVTPRGTSQTLDNDYTYLFIHQLPQTGENLIGIRTIDSKIWICLVGTTETQLVETTGFKSITQIGNVLNVLDATGLKYLIWYDSAYKVISSDIDVKLDLQVNGITNGSGQLCKSYFGISREYQTYGEMTADNAVRKTEYIGLFAKSTNLLKTNGILTGFCLACTAIELFDGSYILQSNPILLGQDFDTGNRYSTETPIGTRSYDSSDRMNFIFTNAGTYNEATQSYDLGINELWALYRNFERDGGGIINDHKIATSNFPDAGYFLADISTPGTGQVSALRVMRRGNELKFKIDTKLSIDLKPLIKSVSVFCTNEIDMYNYVNTPTQVTRIYGESSSGGIYYSENYYPTIKTNAEIIDELKANQQFYKVHEIPFDDIVEGSTAITAGTWTSIDLKGKLGDNLVNQDELPVDNFTHHSLVPNGQMVYNSKLHVWDYSQHLFEGWGLENFAASTGVGQFQANVITGTKRYWVEVTIKTQTGYSKVVKSYNYNNDTLLGFAGLGPMISYPDSRATNIKFYLEVSIPPSIYVHMLHEYKLTASETQNFAYYIAPELKPISTWETSTLPFTIPTEETPTLIYRNALKVSAINNPFYFPATQTHTIATGIILNVNTNALRMSEGQFGQYPLYVFTSEGIYSLDTGTTIAYNSQSPASTEIPTKNILCSTPFGVVFVGKRGAYVINGQQTELISAQLEQEPVVNTLNNVTIPSFLTFLATLKDILYDAVQNELIFVGTGTYNYVLNIDSKSFYLSTEKIDFEVKNANPLLKVADGLKIKDFSVAKTTSVTVGEVTTTTTDKANISLITRPIYFGIDEVKKMQRAILRGRIYGMTKTVTEPLQAFISLWASNEGINFIMLRGITMSSANQNLNYKDIDMGLMARSTYRNFVVAVDAAVDEQTEIAYLDFEVADNYGNDKMR